MLMMLPERWAAITRPACLVPSSTPPTCTAMVRAKTSASKSTTGVMFPGVPALLTMMSSRPKRPTAWSTSALTSASTVTSARTKTARSPRAAARASPSASRRPASTTLAPSAMNFSAIAAPMPLVAPVTIATLPSRIPMSTRPFVVDPERLRPSWVPR